MIFNLLKKNMDWTILGGIVLGSVVGVFLLHSVVPVTKAAVDDPKVTNKVISSALMEGTTNIPWDSPEGWNWNQDWEKVANTYTREATQSPYWKYMAHEYYNPHNVY